MEEIFTTGRIKNKFIGSKFYFYTNWEYKMSDLYERN